MKKKAHNESEEVKAIHRLESGVDATVVTRNYNISRATLYNWKSKYGGMGHETTRSLTGFTSQCIMRSEAG